MTRARRLALLALAAVTLLSACASADVESAAPPSGTDIASAQTERPEASVPHTNATAEPQEPLNPCLYFDERLFALHTLDAPMWELPELKAAVVPHYAPMLDLLAGVLSAAADQAEPYELVIIIGPDHEGKGGGITLSGRGWSAPAGDVPGSSYIASAILRDRAIAAKENHDLLSADHAASTLVPYVAPILPQTPVLAVLVGKYTAHSRLLALAEAVFELQQQSNTLLLCSIDFSHYQTPDDAREFDARTLDAVTTLDISAILQMDSKNMDSPECMTVFLELCALWQAQPALAEHRIDTFMEDGEKKAGSYMAWTLCSE